MEFKIYADIASRYDKIPKNFVNLIQASRGKISSQNFTLKLMRRVWSKQIRTLKF